MDPFNVAAPAPLANMGNPIRRTESTAKVTGKLVYAADEAGSVPLQAYFLTSGIAGERSRLNWPSRLPRAVIVMTTLG